ncbi:MAG: NlpC/P60 family protein [Lachnospirales bacterium]
MKFKNITLGIIVTMSFATSVYGQSEIVNGYVVLEENTIQNYIPIKETTTSTNSTIFAYGSVNYPTGLSILDTIGGNVIAKAKNRDTLEIIQQEDNFFKIKYNNIVGYVPTGYITESTTPPLVKSNGISNNNNTNADGLIDYATKFIGTPYQWAGKDLLTGVDCSGYTQEIFKNFNITLSGVSYDQINDGIQVNKNQLQKGDLVFFDTEKNNVINHVGIYINNGDFIHASTSSGVIVSNLEEDYYNSSFMGASRVLS